jgi:hypothetical protein
MLKFLDNFVDIKIMKIRKVLKYFYLEFKFETCIQEHFMSSLGNKTIRYYLQGYNFICMLIHKKLI